MGIKKLRMATGAEGNPSDPFLRDTFPEKLVGHKLPEIEDPFGFLPITGGLFMNSLPDFRSDLKTAWPDGRAKHHTEIADLQEGLVFQSGETFQDDSCGRSPPTSMNGPDMGTGIGRDENRQAIGRPDPHFIRFSV